MQNHLEIAELKPALVEGLKLMTPGEKQQSVLYHEETGRYFQLSQQTHVLVSLINGENTLEDIALFFNKQQNTFFQASEIHQILETKFSKLVFYKGENAQESSLERKTPSYLKLSTIVLNAALVEQFARLFKDLFQQRVVLFVLPLFASLFIAAIALQWQHLMQDFAINPSTDWGWFALFVLLSSLFHELGHASACRYYQVRHGGIGVGFYLFTPVMFADVTAAWLLPAKQRIVINMGGIYFEIIFSILIFLAAILTGSFFFLSTGLLILIKLLYNLNPFFRTDGYWVVSDALAIPNLRQRSNDKLNTLLAKAFSLNNPKFKPADWFLATYGLLSWLFIASFLFYVLFVFDGSLIYFPYYLYELAGDVLNGRDLTLGSFFMKLNRFVIPIFFYYLIVRLSTKYIKKILNKSRK